MFGRAVSFLFSFSFYFTGAPQPRATAFPLCPTPQRLLSDNVSIPPLPIAPVSLSFKPINLRLASTSLLFDSTPLSYFIATAFLNKLENHV